MVRVRRGRVKNVSGATLKIHSLGIELANLEVFRFNNLTNPHNLYHAATELDTLIAQGDIEVITPDGDTLAIGEVGLWIEQVWGLRDHYTVMVNAWVTSTVTVNNTWMSDEAGYTHDAIPLFVPEPIVIRTTIIQPNTPDLNNTYAVRLMLDPAGTATAIRTLARLLPNEPYGLRPDSRLKVDPGFYGLRFRRVDGTANSTFNKVRVSVFAEPAPY